MRDPNRVVRIDDNAARGIVTGLILALTIDSAIVAFIYVLVHGT